MDNVVLYKMCDCVCCVYVRERECFVIICVYMYLYICTYMSRHLCNYVYIMWILQWCVKQMYMYI